MIKLLDWEKALDNVEGSEDLLLELAQVFVESAPAMLREIGDAIAANDPAALHRAAHNLKGSARIFAAGGVVEEAMHLEEMGAAGDFSHAQQSWMHLEHETAQLCTALSERIGRAGAGEKKGM